LGRRRRTIFHRCIWKLGYSRREGVLVEDSVEFGGCFERGSDVGVNPQRPSWVSGTTGRQHTMYSQGQTRLAWESPLQPHPRLGRRRSWGLLSRLCSLGSRFRTGRDVLAQRGTPIMVTRHLDAYW